MWVFSHGAIYIWEGNFLKDKMHGFGRWMSFYNNKFEGYIGNWHYGYYHGYGVKVTESGKLYEGLF